MEKKIKSIDELKIGEAQKILGLKQCTTRYGESIQVELIDFKVFLPKRFGDEIIKKGLEKIDHYQTLLVFNGRIKNQKNTIMLNFIKKT